MTKNFYMEFFLNIGNIELNEIDNRSTANITYVIGEKLYTGERYFI